MKLISWNVNGLRACVQKGFLDFFFDANADFFCLQETKLQEGQIDLSLSGYEQYWCYAEKKGYSGTAIFTKHTPTSVTRGIGVPELDHEGRMLTLEYPEFFLVNCYTPNAQRELARLDHRMQWDEAFRNYLSRLDQQKPVILCGDLNVAHKEIDLKNPKSNRGNAGFSDEERESFTKTLECGFTDTFRHLNPDKTEAYTWWSYMFNARQNNAGWRIDYFLVSDRIRDSVYKTPIYSDILGSDHCPVGLELDIMCNGGIWSPNAIQEAALISPDEKPTISPAAKKIIPCVLLFGFLCGCFLLPRSRQTTVPTDPGLLESTTASSPLFVQNVIQDPHFGFIPDEQVKWNVYSYDVPLKQTQFSPSIFSSVFYPAFTDGIDTWPLGQTDIQSCLPEEIVPNTWLRFEMPAQLKESFDGSWYPKPKLISLLSSSKLDDVMNFTVQQYYDPDGKTVAGWFIYGTQPENFILTVSHSETGEPIYMSTNAHRT